MRKIFCFLLFSLIFSLSSLVFSLSPVSAYTILEDLSVKGSVDLSGYNITFGSGAFNLGKYISLNFNQGGSVIYDDTNLHLKTDDNLYLDAPGTTYLSNNLTLKGNTLTLASDSDNPNFINIGKMITLDFNQGDSVIYEDTNLHLKTDDNLYLDIPGITYLQNDLFTTGIITAGRFSGPLTGDVTGNLSGIVTGSLFGNLTGSLSGGSINTTGFTFNSGATAGYVLTTDASGVGSWADLSSTGGPWTLDGTNIYPDDTSYNVGIGTTSPSYDLDVAGDFHVSGNQGIVLFEPNGYEGKSAISGTRTFSTTTDDNWYEGVNIDIVLDGTATDNVSAIGGAFFSYAKQSTTGYLIGLYGEPTLIETGKSVATMKGVIGSPRVGNATASANNVYAVQARPLITNGTITNLYGLHAATSHMTEGSVSNYYGLYAANPLDSTLGTDISNNYALYIEDQKGGITNNYSIYSVGGTNYFGGTVGIGTTNPNAKLEINTQAGTLIGQITRAYSGQTANLTEWQDSSGTVLADVTSAGGAYFASNVGIGTTEPTAQFTIRGTRTEATEGTELITNVADRDFSSITGNWIGTNWSIGSGKATHVAGVNTFSLSGLAAEIGKTYKIVFTVNTTTAGTLTVNFGEVGNSSRVGQSVETLTNQTKMVTATGTGGLVFTPDATWAGTLDNISVKEVTPSSPVLLAENTDATPSLEIRSGGHNGDISDTNTFVGYEAGKFNINAYFSGYLNTAFGNNALKYNTKGSANTAMGSWALAFNTTGTYNTAIGYQALMSNTTGQYNTAIGYSLGQNVTGSYNTAVGLQALLANASGSYNTAIGRDAMSWNVTGSNNTSFGYRAGYGVSGNSFSNNSIFGYKAGSALTTGSNNLLLGYQSGDNLTTGVNNIIIGYDIDAPSVTGSNQLNLGNLIYATGVDGTGTTLSTGNVGIGTTAPQATLDINGYLKLKKNTIQPVACGASYDGSIALTSHYNLCVCNGSSWVKESDGTACSW